MDSKIKALKEQMEAAYQEFKTGYQGQMEQIAEDASQLLAKRLQQAQMQAEQAQREHWSGIYEQMLSLHKQELSRVVESADQRLLEQLRDQIRAEVLAEIKKREQEQEQKQEQEQPPQRKPRTTQRRNQRTTRGD